MDSKPRTTAHMKAQLASESVIRHFLGQYLKKWFDNSLICFLAEFDKKIDPTLMSARYIQSYSQQLMSVA